MSPRTISNSRHAIDTCTFQLHSWRPFHLVQKTTHETKIPDNNLNNSNNNNANSKSCSKPNKRACLSDRASSFSIENLDMSKLSLFEDDGSAKSRRGRAHWMARKRRRRGSRSVSGRSCSVGGGCVSNAYGTCSDFMMANNGGTDSSGELFVNINSFHNSYNYSNDHNDNNVDHSSNNGNGGDVNGELSDNSESRTILKNGNGNGDREGLSSSNVIGFNGMHCYHYNGNGNGLDSQGNESGYGSEPGYRGDAEFGYGDEFDEEEDDNRVLFWGNRFGDAEKMKIIGENTLQKAHHRCRRKKHELRMVDAV
uniref:putative uncharacterized protein DDB_G0286901 n=1 Tax=Erigeron canadensis TaxID=72917 RepID=UPI001CB9BFF9|nr:putative uncharacterized protein DDB_G0286901 [Erigeron canadensis]